MRYMVYWTNRRRDLHGRVMERSYVYIYNIVFESRWNKIQRVAYSSRERWQTENGNEDWTNQTPPIRLNTHYPYTK